MTEPKDAKHREFIDRAIEALAEAAPMELLPSTKSIGEDLARSIARSNTRHQVVRLLASGYGINGGPPDRSELPIAIELGVAADIERIAARIPKFKADAVPEILGEMAVDYLERYLDDTAGLSRWLLYCAIATVPGELEDEDASDREEFRRAIASWLDGHMERYAAQYRLLIDALGRTDRQGDQLRRMAHALAMLTEGAILRAAIDPTVSREEVAEIYRQSALGLVAVFTAAPSDERSVDSLIGEALQPPD